jgi:glycosyltransferase involved in cell wall biosynthesis
LSRSRGVAVLMRVLFVTLYFPPAGGAGVTRPLKLAGHLADLGFEVHVLAPDDPKWIHRDDTLAVPPSLTVHRAHNIGPRARLPGEERFGRGGVDRLALEARLAFRRVLIPDASVLWNVTAIPAARRIVLNHRIDVVLTTSPPGSVHLVGAAVSRRGVHWVADIRDSLARPPQRRRHVRGERRLARLVAARADAVVAAAEPLAEEMRVFRPRGRVEVIENGCDFEDFEGLEYRPGTRFRITHTGHFIGPRSPRPFLDALARTNGDVIARFVGSFRRADRDYADSLGIAERLELVPPVPRRQALGLQRDSEALLLLIPESGGRERGVLSAKLFEYLAAERPILAAVPPDGEAARLLASVGAGLVVPPGDTDGLAAGIAELERRWRALELEAAPLSEEARARLSRRARAEELAELLRRLP